MPIPASFHNPHPKPILVRNAKSQGDTPRSLPTTGGAQSVTERNISIEPVLKTELVDGISVDAEGFFEKILHTDRFSDQQVKKCFQALVKDKLFTQDKHFAIPHNQREPGMYKPLVQILNAIAKAASEAGVANAKDDIWLPVSGGILGKDPNHQSIFPDIASTFQSNEDAQDDENPMIGDGPVTGKAVSWQNLAIICEVKLKEDMDNKEAVHLQLAKYARKVLMYQKGRRRFVLGWTLCGDVARAWLFDRSGALASTSFNINDHYERFIRMIIAFSSLSSEELGYDPTIYEKDDKLLLDFTYYNAAGDLETDTYVITESIVPRPSLRGRGTVVWRAYLWRERFTPESERQFFAIKDSWRDLHRDFSEGQFFDKIDDLTLHDGIVEVVRFANVEIVKGSKRLQDTIEYTVRQGVRGSRGNSFDHRGHVRLLMKEFGASLDRFSSLRELIGVIMDAIEGHRKLMERSILHRDVSIGNILMTEKKDEALNRRRGYLIDLDFAKDLAAQHLDDAAEDKPTEPTATPGNEAPEKARVTGTLPFIAIDILRGKQKHREVHDLESFFWIIVWMCLKYQGPNSNLVELTPGTENEMRVENLELLLKCDTLSKGGKQKHGVLAHCREHDGLKEFSHEFFWRLSLCVSDLAKVITRGMDYDDELKGGKQPDFEDKRTYSEFLRILRETYETLPEKDPEHLCGPRRGRKIGKVEKTITKEMATMSLDDEVLHEPRQQSVGSFKSRSDRSPSRMAELLRPSKPAPRPGLRSGTRNQASVPEHDEEPKAGSSKASVPKPVEKGQHGSSKPAVSETNKKDKGKSTRGPWR